MRMTSGESIVLDGRLDDAIWRRTQPAGDFVQQDPDNGQPATEQTEVRIVYDVDARFATLDRRASSKLLYTHRF